MLLNYIFLNSDCRMNSALKYELFLVFIVSFIYLYIYYFYYYVKTTDVVVVVVIICVKL